ncbi:hypothetical protein JOD17_003156 [Geomicrobium sediminis]|uniref:Uncharacterized protein n=1 Tax=Geomicrobium sediminis TaxID=1347788 RepID=A0ABS2PGE9_9BACL|nr:hypothetical protein [Geomicrobium sediminis]
MKTMTKSEQIKWQRKVIREEIQEEEVNKRAREIAERVLG